MVLNRNTGILVYFSVSEVIDNAARETLYKIKVFVYANLLCFLFLLYYSAKPYSIQAKDHTNKIYKFHT